jgi:hypothetical protein
MNLFPSKFTRSTLLTFALIGLLSNSLYAYIPMRWGYNGVIYLKNAADRFPLRFQMSSSTANGTENLSVGSDPVGAFRAAMSSWQDVQTATVRFAALQTTPIASTDPSDGINLVTMADTDANEQILGVTDLNPGPLALTRIVFNTYTGQITDTDIIVNPEYPFSTSLELNAYDLQSIFTHELGHALGCDHGSSQGDTMFFLTYMGQYFQRYISADSAAFAGFTYPDATRAAKVNSISGRVTQQGNPVFGASVTAINIDHNLTYTAITESNGNYTITGPVAGRYVLYAEPLDGPMTSDQLIQSGFAQDYYKYINSSFRTTFYAPTPLTVSGSLFNINFSVSLQAPTLNIDRMGRAEPYNGSVGYLAPGAVIVNPGEFLRLIIGGQGTSSLVSLSGVEILGTGISIFDDHLVPKQIKNQNGDLVGTSVLIRVAPDAAPGQRSVTLKINNEKVASTAGIVVAGKSFSSSALYIPYITTSRDQYTGLALANVSSDSAVVRITGRDNQGALFFDSNAIVPADLSLAPGAQSARLEREIFNLPAATQQAGSITVESDSSAIGGFFTNWNLAGTYLNGAEAFTQAYDTLYFLEVIQNSLTSTEIHLMNVLDVPVSVQLSLVDPRGNELAQPPAMNIPAHGKISGPISTLFGYGGSLNSAHVIAQSPLKALTGFDLIRQADIIFGLNAQPASNAKSILYSPQAAMGNINNVNYITRVNIVNVGDSESSLFAFLYDDKGGSAIATAYFEGIKAGGQITFDARAAFGLMQQPNAQGSIKLIGSVGARLVGNIVFGDGDPSAASLKFGAALPMSATGLKNFIFSQVAQDSQYFTGIALMAPDLPEGSEIPSIVQLEAYRKDGTPAGEPYFLSLDPRARTVNLLEKLIPETSGQVGGYVLGKVISGGPVIGYAVMGSDGTSITAIPPQKLPE